MKINKRLLTLIAVLTTVAMVLSLAGCRSDESSSSDPLAGDNVSYEQAERGLFKSSMSEYSALQAVWSSQLQNQSGKYSMTLTPEEYIIDLLRESSGGLFETLNPSTVDLAVALDAGNMFYGLTYKNGDKEIAALNMWLTENNVIFSVPQLLGKYITIDSSMLEMFGMAGMLDSLNPDVPELPSEAAIQAIIDAAMNKYFELVKDAPVTGEVALTVDGRELSADKTEIELTDEIMLEVSIALLKAVDASSEIKGFINEFIELMDLDSLQLENNFDSALAKAIEKVEAELAEIDNPEVKAVMNAYVVGSLIVKRELTVPDEDGKITLVSINANGEFFTDMIFEGEGSLLRVTEKGTNADSVYTGVADIQIKSSIMGSNFDYTVKMSYDGLTLNDKFEVTAGNIKISMADIPGLGNGELSLTFRSDSFVGGFTIDGVKVATAEISWEDSFTMPAVPSVDASNSVSAESMDEYTMAEVMANLAQLMIEFETGSYDLLAALIVPIVVSMTGMLGGGGMVF
jgi:hypothetical protein